MRNHWASLVCVFSVIGCGVFGSSGTDEAPAGGEATPEPGAGPALPPDAPPPLAGEPNEDELTEKYGVFVSPNGRPEGDGSRARPLASIAAAIERVKTSKLRVYVCAGLYKESLTLESGVSMVGTLTCDGPTWRTSLQRARLEAPSSPALRARDIDLATRFDGFDVVAPAGSEVAPSSIALIAERASKLVVSGSKLAAGKGFDGVDGGEGTQLTLGATATGVDGRPYVPPFVVAAGDFDPGIQIYYGSAGGVASCGGEAGHEGGNGGPGGNGGSHICKGTVDPVSGSTFYFWRIYVTNGGVAYNRTDAPVLSGAAGAAGTDGASAATIGTLSPEGYTPLSGTDGANGAGGTGGSGGNGGANFTNSCTGLSAYRLYGVAGPGGGAGGCPGLAGKAGTGGGASIGALVFASPGIAFNGSELIAADGGRGGSGTFGSEPTPGGNPGMIKNGSPPGAAGGAGGRAGFSGNGAGGPSLAVAYQGGAPVIAPDTTTTAGAGGAGVAERSRTDAVGNAVTIPASVTGLAKALHAL